MNETINQTINNTITATAPIVYAPDRILSIMPDWILFVLLAVIGFAIYSVLPEDMQKGTQKLLKKFGFWICLAIFYFYFKDKWGLVRDNEWPGGISQASFFVGFVILLVWGATSWLVEQKYYTNHLIGDSISGSVHRFSEIEGTDGIIYCVFFLGTSGSSDERFVFPWPWPQKIVVAPKIVCQFIGNQILVKAQISKAGILEVDENVAHFIETDTFGKSAIEDIYSGTAEIEIATSNPEYRTLVSNLAKANSRINELKKMLEGKLEATKGFVNDTRGIIDKLEGKSWKRNQQQSPPPAE